jgi:L-ribulose-5-phosphate 3-epimerase
MFLALRDPPMLLGYNTNGFAHHRLDDALRILSALGYQSIALTLDHHALDPFEAGLSAQLEQVGILLQQLSLRCVIETGSRFLLDPWRKHQPTLLDPTPEGRRLRLEFLCRAVDIAAHLQADAVSFWSGKAIPAEPDTVLWPRLVEGIQRLCAYAEQRNVRLAFEPEPGMFIDTMPRYAELFRLASHPCFGLTLDIGHLHCMNELPIASHINAWRGCLWNVHIEDMRKGVHDHLMFGEGEIDFRPVLSALRAAGYTGGLHVELSRHSHDAVETARRALAFLRERQG